jgi:aminoglycoside phosphotransferase family enzyme/predicted kinase
MITNVTSERGLAPGLERWLMAGAGGGAPCQRKIETSISWVFLYPDRALKLKRPVDFGFLDFTTPDRRRWAAERELAFNRTTAPDIYRAVRAIVRAGDGFGFDGPGEAVDWALEMRRFDERAVLSEQPDVVQGQFAEDLGRQVARAHAAAPRGREGGGTTGLRKTVDSNARQLRALAAMFGAGQVETLIAAQARELARLRERLDRRLGQGFVRRCHGDLHLGNILLEHGRAVLFDCIEFSDAMSEIDVLYDLAFLLMDLAFRGRTEGANRVLNGWCDEAARSFGPGVWRGLAALGLFQSVRATVRAHVLGHSGDAAGAARYFEAAGMHLRSGGARVVAVGGLSGSGKSTFARALAPLLGPAPGAVVLRSDEIRKRLMGRAPLEPLPPEAYGREASRRVYAAMLRAARACLEAGWPVVLDAAHLDPAERGRAERLAGRLGAPFQGVWLEAPAPVLRARLARRAGDASDADGRVLDGQLGRDVGPISWTRLQPEDMAAAARAVAAD